MWLTRQFFCSLASGYLTNINAEPNQPASWLNGDLSFTFARASNPFL